MADKATVLNPLSVAVECRCCCGAMIRIEPVAKVRCASCSRTWVVEAIDDQFLQIEPLREQPHLERTVSVRLRSR